MNASERTEIRTITDKILEGHELNSEQTRRLDQLLTDPKAREYYLELIEVDSFIPETLEHAEIIAKLDTKPASKMKPWLYGAAAAAITFSLGWLMQKPSLETEDSPIAKHTVEADSPTAQITGLIGVRWNKEMGTQVNTNDIDIISGLVELTYPSGTRVVIQGPAKYSVTGENEGDFSHGKFVANVPKGAEGFTVNYNNGKIVDLGTEFGCSLSPSGQLQVGVFDGEIELHPKQSERVVLLTENQALQQESASPETLISIPFDRSAFMRETPSREFAWKIDSPNTKKLSFDVSHLIWRSGNYRSVLKWMAGKTAVKISSITLSLNGEPVYTKKQQASVGKLQDTSGNVFNLNIPEGQHRSGVWTVTMEVEPFTVQHPFRGLVQGVFTFEERGATQSVKQDFVGRWVYRYNGNDFVRVHHANGTLELFRNGKLYVPGMTKATWTVENGIMRIWIPQINSYEDLILRDKNTLIFTDQPYRPAHRVK